MVGIYYLLITSKWFNFYFHMTKGRLVEKLAWALKVVQLLNHYYLANASYFRLENLINKDKIN